MMNRAPSSRLSSVLPRKNRSSKAAVRTSVRVREPIACHSRARTDSFKEEAVIELTIGSIT